MKFSEQQQRVISSRGKNLLVSAAAGSGKTTVLVERVLGLLKEGANIDEILIVTFTRAASQDMRNKLYRRISEEAQAGDEGMYAQLERLEFSSISTLHSFCSRVIRANFELSDVDPAFHMLDEADNAMLIERELFNVLESAYTGEDEGFQKLSARRSDDTLRQMILETYDFMTTRPEADEWFNSALKLIEEGGKRWFDAITESARGYMDEAIALGEYALELTKKPSGPMELENALEVELNQIRAARDLNYEELREAVGAFKGGRAGRKSNDGDIDLKQAASDLRDRMKKLFKEKVAALVSLPPDVAISDLQSDIPALKSLWALAKALEEQLRLAKRERSALTFNDLEHITIELLKREDVCQRLKKQYKYVFVDEYQDTSDIQETIVSRIAGLNNRFMVGDVKQSIYRFRNAVPELFMQKYEEYSKGGENELIVLGQNFRSRSSVLEFVNLLFERVMTGGKSEIVYGEDAKLRLGGSFEGEDAPTEVIIIDKGAEEEAGEDETDEEIPDNRESDEEELKDAELEALAIAQRITELRIQNPELKYRDFCVLTRVKKNVLASMAQILTYCGIPAYADETDNAFDALEVSVVISALKLLLNRRRELDLLSVLRSPMFMLSSSDLSRLRISVPKGRLWDALEPNRDKIEGVDRFLSFYEKWRLIMRYMPISSLIRRVLDDTGYYSFMGALPGGKHRQANLDMLCELALSYELTQGRSLSGFLEHMARKKSTNDGSGAHELSENDDVVRLMTAHKSKGLEFKIVFASLLGRRMRAGVSAEACLADKDLGIAFPHIDTTLGSVRPTVAMKAIKAYKRQKDRAEELRVLYVTLTRAQQRLILTGTVKDLEASKVKWRLAAKRPDMYDCALDVVAPSILNCKGCEALGERAEEGKPDVALTIVPASTLKLPDKSQGEDAASGIYELLKSELWDEELYKAMTWVYPQKQRPQAPLKLAVTGLEKEFTGGTELPRMKTAPSFISGEDRNLYTERGTAVHTALQSLDYAPFRDKRDIFEASREAARQLNEMADRQLLSTQERRLVKPSVIAGFMLSDIGQRAINSPRVMREWRFTLLMPTKRVVQNYEGDDNIIVQGSIDLCFMEDGEWVLIDYKTDKSHDDDELIMRYGAQIDVYAEALETLTETPVKEARICLVSENRSIEVEPKRWTKGSRRPSPLEA